MNSNHPKKIFVTFADSRMHRTLKRIRKQADAIGVYDEIYSLTESDLDINFKRDLSHILVKGVRGYGFWCWKPQVILQILQTCKIGDIVHWADAGCWINKNGKTRLLEYFELASTCEVGVLAFQNNNSNNGINLTENRWTKSDTFYHFNVQNNAKITETNQIEATTFFVRKCDSSVKLILDWSRIWHEQLNLVTDVPSVHQNFPNFVENRHDQSVFSILLKIHGAQTISADETYKQRIAKNQPSNRCQYNWGQEMDKYPVWAKRDKDLGYIGWLTHYCANKVAKIRKLFSKNANFQRKWY